MSSALDRLKNLTAQISSYELERKNNLKTLEELYQKLGLQRKIDSFDECSFKPNQFMFYPSCAVGADKWVEVS